MSVWVCWHHVYGLWRPPKRYLSINLELKIFFFLIFVNIILFDHKLIHYFFTCLKSCPARPAMWFASLKLIWFYMRGCIRALSRTPALSVTTAALKRVTYQVTSSRCINKARYRSLSAQSVQKCVLKNVI
jgi:hypothetical protein